MSKHTVTFEIESRSNALSVSRLINDLYNRLREEHREIQKGEKVGDTMLSDFEDLKKAMGREPKGKITIIYETDSEE